MKRVLFTAGIHIGLAIGIFNNIGQAMQFFGHMLTFLDALGILVAAFWIALGYLLIKEVSRVSPKPL